MKPLKPDESRPRGRPRSGDRQDLSDRLLSALRSELNEKSYAEITLKEVADRAGTSQEMVRYYFGGKDGLITAMLRQTALGIEERLNRLEQEIAGGIDDPTRQIVITLTDIYLDVRGSMRVSFPEFQKAKSSIKDEHLSKRSGLIIGKLHDIVRLLMEQGIYASSLNPEHVALSMMVQAGLVVQLLPSLAPEWLSEEMLRGEEWTDHLVALFDGLCRANA